MGHMNAWLVLMHRPAREVQSGDVEFVESTIKPISPEQILVRNIYLSLDPTNRVWMSGREQYLPPVGVGDVMRGTTVGVVEDSASLRFQRDDIVLLGEGWQRYSTSDASMAVRMNRLFRGDRDDKLIVQISDEPSA